MANKVKSQDKNFVDVGFWAFAALVWDGLGCGSLRLTMASTWHPVDSVSRVRDVFE